MVKMSILGIFRYNQNNHIFTKTLI